MINLSPINPTSPGFIDRFPVKKVALVTTILLLVLGIILIIGGSVGFMPLLPGVISGAILLGVVASFVGFQLVRHLSKDKKAELTPKMLEEPEIQLSSQELLKQHKQRQFLAQVDGWKGYRKSRRYCSPMKKIRQFFNS